MLRRVRILPQAAAPRAVTALEYRRAVLLPDLSGWWVYALGHSGDGHVFYVGQSENLLSRLRDQAYGFREQYDPARVWLVAVADQGEADLVELDLIRFYDPECNTLGRRAELEDRNRGRNRGFHDGHRYGNGPRRQPLDTSQATG